jgi:hypothetical protein
MSPASIKVKRRHGGSPESQTSRTKQRRLSVRPEAETLACLNTDYQILGSGPRSTRGVREPSLPDASSQSPSARSASRIVNEFDDELFAGMTYFVFSFCDIPSNSLDHYSISADEVKEDEDLVVIGEDPALVEDDTIPIRGLNQFTIYVDETKELVNIANLISERDSKNLRMYRASGFVTPWTEDSDLDDELESDRDSGQYVQLARIRHLNIFHYMRGDVDRYV